MWVRYKYVWTHGEDSEWTWCPLRGMDGSILPPDADKAEVEDSLHENLYALKAEVDAQDHFLDIKYEFHTEVIKPELKRQVIDKLRGVKYQIAYIQELVEYL